MKKVLLYYMSFIGSYACIFFFLEIIPLEVNLFFVVALGFAGMITTLIYLTKRNDFDSYKFCHANLIFVLLFCGSTVIYDKAFGLTDLIALGNTIKIQNSSFYGYTWQINHIIILSTLLLLVHSIWAKKLKPILIVLLSVVIIAGYLISIV